MPLPTTTARQFAWLWVTRAFAGRLGRADLVAGLVSIVATPIWQWLYPMQEGLMNWLPLLIFAAVFVGSLVIGALTAPYWLYRKLENEKNLLAAKLNNRDARQKSIARLWHLRAEGVEHRNKAIGPSDETAWIKDFENWRARVLADAGVISLNLQAWLTTLDRVRPGPNLAPPVSNAHSSCRGNMSEILFRLQEFLEAEMLRRDIETHDA